MKHIIVMLTLGIIWFIVGGLIYENTALSGVGFLFILISSIMWVTEKKQKKKRNKNESVFSFLRTE